MVHRSRRLCRRLENEPRIVLHGLHPRLEVGVVIFKVVPPWAQTKLFAEEAATDFGNQFLEGIGTGPRSENVVFG